MIFVIMGASRGLRGEGGGWILPGRETALDFQPDETQSRIRELAKAFVKECVAPEAETWEREEHIPEDFLKRMAQQGFLGMVAGAEYGGSGIDPVGWVLAVAEVAAASPTLGFVMSINNQFCDAIQSAADDEQKQRILPDHVAGGKIGSQPRPGDPGRPRLFRDQR